MVREHAEEQGYAFIGPVTVAFERDDELPTGLFQVRSAAVAGATAAERRPACRRPRSRHRGPLGRGRQHDVRRWPGP